MKQLREEPREHGEQSNYRQQRCREGNSVCVKFISDFSFDWKRLYFTLTLCGKLATTYINCTFECDVSFFSVTSFFFYFFLFLNFTILYWFCQISKWIRHRYTCVPHPEPSSLLPPHTLPLGHPSAPAPSIQYHASNLDWRLVSYMILYMFQCHSPKSSHPLPLSQSP